MKNFNIILIVYCFIVSLSCSQSSIYIEGAEDRHVQPHSIVDVKPDTTISHFFSGMAEVAREIQLVNDTVLVFSVKPSESEIYHFKAYSTRDYGFLGEFLPDGKGPGEIIYPYMVRCSSSEPVLNLRSSELRKTYSVDIASTLSSGRADITNEFPLAASVVDWVPLSDSKELTLEQVSDFMAICINEKGERVYTFPFIPEISNSNCVTYLSGSFAVDRKNGRVVNVMFFFPRVNIYDTVSKRVLSLMTDAHLKDWNAVVSSRFGPDTKQYYGPVACSEDYIFLVYSERLVFGGELPDAKKAIQVFNWNGDFLYEFPVSENIESITFDSSTSWLYALGEGHVIRYDMNRFL